MKQQETHYPGDSHFHYDRKKREETLSGYAKTNLHTKGSVFSRNRGLKITLLDLVVLVLLVVSVSVFLRTRGPSSVSGEIDVYGEAYRSGDRIIVSLTLERLSEEAPSGPVRVVFRALPGDNRLELDDVLPDSVGGSRTLRGAVPDPGDGGNTRVRVFATVYIGGEGTVFTLEVQDEDPAPNS